MESEVRVTILVFFVVHMKFMQNLSSKLHHKKISFLFSYRTFPLHRQSDVFNILDYEITHGAQCI